MTEMYTFDNTLVVFDEEQRQVTATLSPDDVATFKATERKWEATKERIALHGYLAACLNMPYSPYLLMQARGTEPTSLEQYEEKVVKSLGGFVKLAKEHDWQQLIEEIDNEE